MPRSARLTCSPGGGVVHGAVLAATGGLLGPAAQPLPVARPALTIGLGSGLGAEARNDDRSSLHWMSSGSSAGSTAEATATARRYIASASASRPVRSKTIASLCRVAATSGWASPTDCRSAGAAHRTDAPPPSPGSRPRRPAQPHRSPAADRRTRPAYHLRAVGAWGLRSKTVEIVPVEGAAPRCAPQLPVVALTPDFGTDATRISSALPRVGRTWREPLKLPMRTTTRSCDGMIHTCWPPAPFIE